MSHCIYQAREPEIQPSNQNQTAGKDLSSSGGFSVHYSTKLYTSVDCKSSSDNKKGVIFLTVTSLTLLQDDNSVFLTRQMRWFTRVFIPDKTFNTMSTNGERIQTDQGLLLLCLPVKLSLLTGTKHVGAVNSDLPPHIYSNF